MGYDIEGRMLEVCSCESVCPCWNGLDPDGGECDFNWVFDFDRGRINDVEVSGLKMAFLGHLPGNVFDGGIRLTVLVDEQADDRQRDALLAAFTGQAGGPLADLAGLVAEVEGVYRAQIEFDVDKGSGRFRAGDRFAGEVEGYRSPTGAPTQHLDTMLSPALGSPAYPGKVVSFTLGTERAAAGGSIQTEFHHVAA